VTVKTSLYVAGPMRGYERFNFDAFEEATTYLRSVGFTIVSPAEMDLDMGLDPDIANTDDEAGFDIADAMRRDFDTIVNKVDGIILLPGWETSSGARAERFVAETCGKRVFAYDPDGDHNARINPAPEWNCDPRKPDFFDRMRVESLDDAIKAIEEEGFVVIRDVSSAEVQENAARLSAAKFAERNESFNLEQQRALATVPAIPRRDTDATTGYVKRVTSDSPSAAEADTTNPKDLLGVKKPQLHLVPRSLIIRVAQAMADGARKYGPFNWRTKGVRASIYVDAAERHLGQWFDGEECAKDSGVPHLAHAAACIGILIDAEATGNLVDDRPTPGAASKLIEELTAS
jgi:hypothetical protein